LPVRDRHVHTRYHGDALGNTDSHPHRQSGRLRAVLDLSAYSMGLCIYLAYTYAEADPHSYTDIHQNA
jgi:hypothetical protein